MVLGTAAGYTVGTASNAVCTLETMPRMPLYWDGPDWKGWDATDNGGLSWWRWNATNGPFSAIPPGSGDTGYHLKAGIRMVKGADLGAPGQYAVIRLGNDARLRAQNTGRYNPLIIEATGAGLGDTANGDESCSNPITLEGRMDVRRGRTMNIYGYLSGTGSVTYLGSCTIYGYTNSYTGGTRINPNIQVTTASGVWPNDQDGFFGTGPVDMSHGAEHYVTKSPWNASFARFLNSRSSYYGSAGGTNRVAQSDSKDWDIYGSNVTWRPGPRDGSGVGTMRVYNIANLKGSGDSTNGYPRLLIGMKLGGVCDKLLLTTNAVKPYFKPNGNLRLVLDNVDAGQPAGAWVGQGGAKYTIVELDGPVSDHAVTGRFRNDYQVVDATTDKILFAEGGFRSANITYQGDAATQATSGGNDILLWNLVPTEFRAGTIVILQ